MAARVKSSNDYEFKAMLESRLGAKWLTDVETKTRVYGFQSVLDGGNYATHSIDTSHEVSGNNVHGVQDRRLTQVRQPVSDESINNELESERDVGHDEQPKQRKRKARDVPGSIVVLGRETRPSAKVRKGDNRNGTGQELNRQKLRNKYNRQKSITISVANILTKSFKRKHCQSTKRR